MKAVLSDHNQLLRYDYLYEQAPQERDYFNHLHNAYELFFFYNGNADYKIDNRIFHLHKNDMLLILPTQHHKLCILSPMPYERGVFNFQSKILSDEEIRILGDAAPLYHVEKDSLIENAFADLKRYEHIYSESDFDMLKSFCLHNIVTNIKYLPKPEDDERRKRTLTDCMIDYINEHIEEPLTADILAKRFFTSKSYVEHAFLKNLEISCKRFINKKKMLYAQNLIASGVPVTQVAARLSFNNYSTFYRQYKTVLGTPPIDDRFSD